MRVIDRYHPRRRQSTQAAIYAGQIRVRDELALLEPEQLRPLASLSLVLLFIGSLLFGGLLFVGALNTVQLFALTVPELFLLIIVNILGYLIILPIHEGIHALALLFWGGRPHFGIKFLPETRIPLALYCGARHQLFRRDAYLVIALAPLVGITLLGGIGALLFPQFALYTLLALVGNFSGAAGDLLVTWRVGHLPRSVLIEDTETGYRAWQLAT